MKKTILCALMATTIMGVFMPLAQAGSPLQSFFGGQAPAAAPAGNAAMPLVQTATLAPMLKNVMPGVVNIAVKGKVSERDMPEGSPFDDPDNPLFNDPLFKRFFHFDMPPGAQGNEGGGQSAPAPREHEIQGAGSGVIVDAAKGYILTNNHVVHDADEIYVITDDKRKLEAKVVGADPDTDIAVIQVKEDHLTQVPLGNSDGLQIGDFVVAIGNPFGLSHTVTSGIVSALGRSGLGIEGYEDFIQTDAAINPGNSGGALVNLKGELVGINTAIFSRSGGSMGIGFAIPANMAKAVMDQLIAHGEVQRGRIGVNIQDITPDIADTLGMDVLKGALVANVAPGSPADKAGLKTGDVILKYNGEEIKDASDLKNRVGLTRLGDNASLDIMRDKKPLSLGVKIEKFDLGGEGAEISGVSLFKGARVSALHADHPLSGKVEGVQVTDVENGSPAWRAGLQKDDVIVSANQTAVKTPEELEKAAQGADKGKGLLLNIRRGEGALFIVVKQE